jgi:hypothetical protein
MTSEIKRNPNIASEYGTASTMSVDEKRISFLNRYFVFRKATRVNAEKIFKLHMKHNIELPVLSEIENKILEQSQRTSSQKIKIKPSKGKRITILLPTNESSSVSLEKNDEKEDDKMSSETIPVSPPTKSAIEMPNKFSIKIKKPTKNK